MGGRSPCRERERKGTDDISGRRNKMIKGTEPLPVSALLEFGWYSSSVL
jgi:hypothetical protein